MAASPSLHEWFHADAGRAEHQCAVTLFAHGKVDTASVDVPIAAVLTFIETVPSVTISVFSPAIENLPPRRRSARSSRSFLIRQFQAAPCAGLELFSNS